jgi:hypothetical protein
VNVIAQFEELPTGQPVTAVKYELLSWEELPPTRPDVESVSTAVILQFQDETVARFHWHLRPPSEYLALGPWLPGDPTSPTREVDVSDRWSVIGASLTSYSLAHQQIGDSLSPWSCHLRFGGELHMIISLGEQTESGDLTYIPDSLLVMDTPARARTYWPRAALTSALGATD